MVKVVYRESKYNADRLLGAFLDDRHYDDLITADADLYAPSIDGSMTENNIVAKFRKGVFSKEEQLNAYEGLRGAAVQSQNRGIAAGPRGDKLSTNGRSGRDWVTQYQFDVLDFLTRPDNAFVDPNETLETIAQRKHHSDKEDINGFVWMTSKITENFGVYEGWFDRWTAGLHNKSKEMQKQEAELVKTCISKTNYAQSVMSGVAGFYDRYPRMPYGRPCSYNEKHPELFAKSFPYLNKLNEIFRKELPVRWKCQNDCAQKIDPRFRIADTCFTTLTVNHNWRSAAHLDAGDLGGGFSNISTVSSKDGWGGGELICPEYRAAIKFEPGDLLLVANHTAIHGNAALDPDMDNDRLSIVAYFRENMLELKSWEYENLRRQFIEERKHNENHPEWRKLWNGISPGLFESKEWYDYMNANGMKDPYGGVVAQSLEGFF